MSVRHLLDRLRRHGKEPAPDPSGYREPAPITALEAIGDLEASISALQREVRTLRRQLGDAGVEPHSSPSAHEVRAVVQILEGLARGECPRQNTVEFALLANAMRALLEAE